METFDIPAWVITFMPLLVLVVTFLLAKVPAIAEFGPRNIGAVVSCALAAVVILLNPPVLAGADVMDYLTVIVGLVGYWWKGAQAIFDLFTGQLGLPESHAS